MMLWINLLGYQAVWFTAVIGAAHGKTWPALLAGIVFVASQVALARRPSTELRLLAMALIFGLMIDGVLAYMAWAHYAASSPAIPARGAPLWILVLWSSFAMTINQSLAYLRERWWLASALGLIGAPLAYLGAQRGWQAVYFQPPVWRGLAWLSIGWAIALPSLGTIAHRLSLHTRAGRTSLRVHRP